MELKDFVKETLNQIVACIEEAQTEVRNCGGFVKPAYRVNSNNSDGSHFGVMETGQNIFLIDFNVAVTVIEDKGTDANVKLNVASFLNLGERVESQAHQVMLRTKLILKFH